MEDWAFRLAEAFEDVEESELQRLPAEEAELLPHPQAAEAPAQGGMQADVQRRAAEGAVARDAAAASGAGPGTTQHAAVRSTLPAGAGVAGQFEGSNTVDQGGEFFTLSSKRDKDTVAVAGGQPSPAVPPAAKS